MKKLLTDILTKNGKYCINKTWYCIACIIFCVVVIVEMIRGNVRYDIMLLFMGTVGGFGMLNKGLDVAKFKKGGNYD